MPTPEKVAVVEELTERLARSRALILTDHRGLTVKESTELRRRLREAGVDFKVAKNTLLSRAAQKAGIEGLDPFLAGPTSVTFVYTDPVAPAKVLSEFARTHPNLSFKGGWLDGKSISADQVKALADLPPREVLLAQVLAGMQAPISGFVGVLHGTLAKLVRVLDAVRQQREGAASA